MERQQEFLLRPEVPRAQLPLWNHRRKQQKRWLVVQLQEPRQQKRPLSAQPPGSAQPACSVQLPQQQPSQLPHALP